VTVKTTYPDGTSWSVSRGSDTRIIIQAHGSFSAKRARELAEAIEWEARRVDEILGPAINRHF